MKAQDDDDFAERLAELDDALANGSVCSSGATAEIDMDARLKRGLAALQALRQMRGPKLPTPSTLAGKNNDTLHAASSGPAPRQLGRFQIVRELGRGGFGIVFLARDPKLHRDVALKVPHAAALVDCSLRERFRREAQTAAGLNHPHIVSVYEADESGPICWIAYAFCRGIALSEWLAQQSAPVSGNDAAKLIAALADAVHHAHERGILHRDLKPANVLLQIPDSKTPSENQDSTKRSPVNNLKTEICDLQVAIPKITDFGLAKLMDEPGEMTRTGAILGTPAYMAPEQARARGSIDVRADVYSLGAVLYAMLTGQPPIRGESDLDTLQLVQMIEPIAPRRLRPKLHRDLETICLKCLDKNPARRYASAAELRDDLNRFLENAPVIARPISSVGRLVRWCHRKPVVAGLIAALMIAVSLGAAGIIREWRRANSQRDSALAERDRSVKLLGQAHDLLDRLHAVGEDLRKDTKTATKGREILQETLGYYQHLLNVSGGEPTFQSEIARVSRMAGLTLRDLGRLDEAVVTYQTGLNALDELARHEPAAKDLLERRIDLLMLQGDSLRSSRRIDEAVKVFETCLSLTSPAAEDIHASNQLARSHAQALLQFGILAKDRREFVTCVDKTRKAASILRRLSEADPNDVDLRGDFGQALDGLSAALYLADQLDDAERTINECLDLQKELWKLNPKSLRAQLAVAMSFGRLGDVALKRGQVNESIAYNREAAIVYDEAAASCPNIPQVHRDYSNLLIQQASLFEKQKKYDDASACLDKAVIARLRLVEIQATSSRRRIDLAHALFLQGRMAMARNDVLAAQTAIKRARIQLNSLKPSTTIPELVNELKTLSEMVDQLENYANGKSVAKPNVAPVID